VPEVDCFVDCVGFSQRARSNGGAGCCFKSSHGNYRIGSIIGIPGLYVTEDPGATKHQNKGAFKIRFDW
jgi:glutathione-independent formaldehyde dehydrogenase